MNAEQFAASPNNYFPLLPIGEFENAHTGMVNLVDHRAIISILNDFERRASEPNFPGLLVDIDHQSQTDTGGTLASGWIVGLDTTDDYIWGRIIWSDEGAAMVATRTFSFLSAVLAMDELDDGRRRIVGIVGAGLTNTPSAPMPPLLTFDDDDDDGLGNDDEDDGGVLVGNEAADGEHDYVNRLRGEAMLISNRGSADFARQRIDENWVQTSDGSVFNNWVELCKRLNLDPEQSDDDDVKCALNQFQHTHRSTLGQGPGAKRFRNRHDDARLRAIGERKEGFSIGSGFFHTKARNPNLLNRETIAHMIRDRMNLNHRGSIREDTPARTVTRDEPFAGPTRYTSPAHYSPGPVYTPSKARLQWRPWLNDGPPQLYSDERNEENDRKMEELTQRMCKGKSSRYIRDLATHFNGDYWMKSRLHKIADERDQEERANRLGNRARKPFRPLGSPSVLTNR